MSSQLPVLIVGAGPTGLMMACELARHGVSFRIIDKKSEPTQGSNATWIQSRTIEILNQIGIADRFLKNGQTCDAINLYAEGKFLAALTLEDIPSTYPFILMLAQSGSERLLNERLSEFKIKVERSTELTDLKQKGNTVIATVKRADGGTETVTCDWLVACDGARSFVREKCRIFFPGEDLSEQFIVADAKIDSFMTKDEIHFFFDQGSMFAAATLGENNYRITANLHLDHPRMNYTEREVIEMAQERAHGAYYVRNVSWISPFWIHSKVIREMRQQSIFFAGDAAHVHSPAGGQGMNMGLQDAFNLAWKLALVIKGKARAVLLESYQSERLPVIRQVVNQTERLTKMALNDRAFLKKLGKFSDRLVKDKKLARKIGTQISQLDIRYKYARTIASRVRPGAKSPQPGERAPDVLLKSNRRLYEHLRNTRHNVLVFTGSALSRARMKDLRNMRESLQQAYDGEVVLHVISRKELKDIANVIVDADGGIHDCYQVKTACLFLVRPDGYIAYYSRKLDSTSLLRFLRKYFY